MQITPGFLNNTLLIQSLKIYNKSSLDTPNINTKDEFLQDLPFYLYLKSDFNHPLGKESILVWDPIYIGILDENTWKEYDLYNHNNPKVYDPSAFNTRIPQVLKNLKVQFRSGEKQELLHIESYIGLYGYTGYETGRLLDPHIHRKDSPQFPLAIYFLPRCYRIETYTHWIYFELELEEPKKKCVLPNLKIDRKYPIPYGVLFDYNSYIQTIEQIQTHIRKGDIYQANFTMPFILPPISKSGYQIFTELFQNNPTPYAAHFCWDQFEIISLSMELFLEIKEGKIITCPIKGTAPRGVTEKEDQQNIQDLQNSTKDHAELAMIVDLLRNDLSRSAHIGSVQVLEHAKLETFSNVHHLISTVTGSIDSTPEASWSLFLRSFPGGSITGCPKLRSMEVIEELEKEPRDIYTGSIGFLAIDGTLKKNIAIRTIIKTPEQIRFNAGGGITIYSQPEQEFFEVYHKIRHFLAYIHGKRLGSIAYLDGMYVPSSVIPEFEKEHQSILTNGCFETILIKNKLPMNLFYHIQRLSEALQYFGTNLMEDLNQILGIIIKLNAAENVRLRIRCILDPKKAKSKYHMLIELFELVNPPEKIQLLIDTIQSLEKSIPTEVRKAGIKSLNYDIFRQATAKGQKAHCWDTLLITAEGVLLECGRATIYCFLNDKWVTPQSDVISGTMRKKLLDKKKVEPETISIKDLSSIKVIAVSNALIGIKQVHSLIKDGKILWETQLISDFRIIDLLNG